MPSENQRPGSSASASLMEKVSPPAAKLLSTTTQPNLAAAKVATEYHFLPAYDTSDRSRSKFYGDDIPNKSTVYQRELNYAISRDELAYHAWERETSALFNRGHTFKAWKESNGKREDNPDLQRQVEGFFKSINADPEIRQSYSLMWHYGFCPIGITRKETLTSLSDLKEPADVTQPIVKIQGISGDQVTNIKLGTTFGADRYGEIESYTILMPTGRGGEDKDTVCHWSRFIHWKSHWIDNHPKGIPRLHPYFDTLASKKHLDYAMREVPRQFARPVPIMRATGTGAERVKKEEFDGMKAAWKDISSASYFVTGPGWEPMLLSTDGALDPQPYRDAIIQSFSTILGSEFATVGAKGGSISTSDANATEFYSAMGDKQRNDIAPIYHELGRLGELSGQITVGENEGWDIVFNPLWEMDDKEMAEVRKFDAQAEFIRAQTIKAYTEAGWVPTMEDDILVMTSPQGASIDISIGMAGLKPALTVNATSEWVDGLDRQDRQKLYREQAPGFKALENEMVDKTQTWLTIFQKEFLELMDQLWPEHMGRRGPGLSGASAAGSAEFQTTLEGWEPSQYNQFVDDLNEFMVDAWSRTGGETAGGLGRTLEAGAIVDSATIAQIEANGTKLAKDLFGNQHKAVMNEIVNGIKTGAGQAEIREAIAQNVFAGVKSMPATINKYIHTEVSEARFRTMRRLGATKFRYLTSNDDRVRPEHAQLEGQIGDESDFMGPLSDFGCRCTIVPVTVWDEIVAEKQREAT